MLILHENNPNLATLYLFKLILSTVTDICILSFGDLKHEPVKLSA